MKSLMLMNARRRRHKKSSRRRNPTAGYSRAYGVGHDYWKKKDFRDGYDYMKTGKLPRGSRRSRRSRRRSSYAAAPVIRRSRRFRGVVVRARKIYVSRPGPKRALIVARNPRRRRHGFRRMNPLIPGNLMGQVKSLFSKDNLTTAAGGVAAAVVANYLTSMKTGTGANEKFLLPRPADPTSAAYKAATVAYAVGIPFAAAIATRKFSPAAARGMVLGGLINGGIKAIKLFAPADSFLNKVLSTAEYLDAVGAGTPSFQATNVNALSASHDRTSAFAGALDNSGAFSSSAW
jgi:hypothetical protein